MQSSMTRGLRPPSAASAICSLSNVTQRELTPAVTVLQLFLCSPKPALRFAAGAASAFVLLNVAAWCMVRLAVLGRPAMGGLIFCGPGVGIVLTGLAASAMVAAQWRAAWGWVVFGVLSVLLFTVRTDAHIGGRGRHQVNQ